MKNLEKLLNRQVANFAVLYTKLHSFHWFVRGPHFYPLHELFEKFYDEVTAHYDSVAERMLMLDLRPADTLKEYLEITCIAEANRTDCADEMLKSIIEDFSKINQDFCEIITEAQKLSDEVTVDLAIGIKSSLQKHIWMLRYNFK